MCLDFGRENIDCKIGKGAHYRGKVSKTLRGIPCEVWPGENHNYCRQSGKEKGGGGNIGKGQPWCNIVDPKRPYLKWEACDVRECSYCDVGKY